MQSEHDKMMAGELYDPRDAELVRRRAWWVEKSHWNSDDAASPGALMARWLVASGG